MHLFSWNEKLQFIWNLEIEKRKKDKKFILDTHDYIKVIVHLFWKIMDFLFYRISLRSSEDMGKNSMWTMPVTILGVIYSVFFSIFLDSLSESNWCYIVHWKNRLIPEVFFVSKFHIKFNSIYWCINHDVCAWDTFYFWFYNFLYILKKRVDTN